MSVPAHRPHNFTTARVLRVTGTCSSRVCGPTLHELLQQRAEGSMSESPMMSGSLGELQLHELVLMEGQSCSA